MTHTHTHPFLPVDPGRRVQHKEEEEGEECKEGSWARACPPPPTGTLLTSSVSVWLERRQAVSRPSDTSLDLQLAHCQVTWAVNQPWSGTSAGVSSRGSPLLTGIFPFFSEKSSAQSLPFLLLTWSPA